MLNFHKKPKPKASDESAEMTKVFHYRWLENNGGHNSAVGSRRGSLSDLNLTPNYTLTKRPRLQGAQDSHQIRRLLNHEMGGRSPPLKKISRQHEIIPNYGEMNFFLKADLKRDFGGDSKPVVRDSGGVRELISGRDAQVR